MDFQHPTVKLVVLHQLQTMAAPQMLMSHQAARHFPICLAKGNTTDPYTNGEFHCVLVCPCAKIQADGQCSDESHGHCPTGSQCQLGELRHRGQGVCTFPSSSINI